MRILYTTNLNVLVQQFHSTRHRRLVQSQKRLDFREQMMQTAVILRHGVHGKFRDDFALVLFAIFQILEKCVVSLVDVHRIHEHNGKSSIELNQCRHDFVDLADDIVLEVLHVDSKLVSSLRQIVKLVQYVTLEIVHGSFDILASVTTIAELSAEVTHTVRCVIDDVYDARCDATDGRDGGHSRRIKRIASLECD